MTSDTTGTTLEYSNRFDTRPEHYNSEIDVITFCEANNLGFSEGNVIKYVVRYKEKNGLEDLYKAQEYLNRLIENYNE